MAILAARVERSTRAIRADGDADVLSRYQKLGGEHGQNSHRGPANCVGLPLQSAGLPPIRRPRAASAGERLGVYAKRAPPWRDGRRVREVPALADGRPGRALVG